MREYVTIRTAPNRAPSVAAALRETRLGRGTARALGLFTAQIGASVNDLFGLVAGEDMVALDRAAKDLSALSDVVAVDRKPLTPVSERNLPLLGDGPAMFTNRWFHVRSDAAQEFEDLTVPVWNGFERDTKCHVIGLWHLSPSEGVTRYLLIAKYDDLLAWSNSRFFSRPGGGEAPAWVGSFARRRELMVDTSVIATRCLGASAG